ncbi:MAG: hypothetical protein J6Z36_04100 [Clostridia bacterium]|nr:hypothetical protein [Clostridia bacterium]
MRIYFLSARPCALKINGEYLGVVDGFERYCNLTPRDKPLCEFIPLNGGFSPLVFLLTENILFQPPAGVSLCILPDGIAVYAEGFPPLPAPLRLIAETALPNGKITVFSDGTPQALVEEGNSSCVFRLGEGFEECNVTVHENLVLLSGMGRVCALFYGEQFFRGEAKNCVFDKETGELSLLTPLADFCNRTADCVWSFNTGKAVLTRCNLSPARLLPPEFILCVFLQNLLLGLPVEDLLSEELQGETENLKGYLGRYEQVIPTEKFPFGAGVVCPKAPCVYEMKYFSAELKEGKIFNVKREI